MISVSATYTRRERTVKLASIHPPPGISDATFMKFKCGTLNFKIFSSGCWLLAVHHHPPPWPLIARLHHATGIYGNHA